MQMEKLRIVDNKDLVSNFYDAFSRQDAEAMAACYHPEVVFSDPAFGTLLGERASQMWRMLCQSQKDKDFKITFSILYADEEKVEVKWEAFYTFSQTGRKVHNTIFANFEFKKGLIFIHQDEFSLHKWAHQAMGMKGLLLGGTGFFRRKLQTQTNKLLDRFILKKKSS